MSCKAESEPSSKRTYTCDQVYGQIRPKVSLGRLEVLNNL